MLTPRQNFLETIRGGNPDRFVKQYEFIKLMPNAYSAHDPRPKYGEMNIKNAWGVYRSWQEGTPGPFPVHTGDKIVIKDIEEWKSYVKAPNVRYSAAEWEPFIAAAEAVDRSQYYVAAMHAPGIFEQCHYLMEIQNCLMAFYEYPDELKDLIKYIADFETALAEEVCKYMKPDALFHHDDWGSQISTFVRPDMFDEFFLDAYKQVYGYYKSHGVEIIVHHSDSYAQTLVPYMIEMGIDVWQGVMRTNDIAGMIGQYGGQISFMGGIDSATIDYEGWTPEVVAARVEEACRQFGAQKKYFIPCGSQGGPMSTYPGVYDATDIEIDRMSRLMF